MSEIKPDLAKLKRVCTENDRKVEELIEQYANILAYYFVESIERAHRDGKTSLTLTVDGLLKEASNHGGPGILVLRVANFSGGHHLAERVAKRALDLVLPATDGTGYTMFLCGTRSTASEISTPEITWKKRT